MLINVLSNYYFDDDFSQDLMNCWCSYVYLFYGNWVFELYEIILFDIFKIGEKSIDLRG